MATKCTIIIFDRILVNHKKVFSPLTSYFKPYKCIPLEFIIKGKSNTLYLLEYSQLCTLTQLYMYIINYI